MNATISKFWGVSAALVFGVFLMAFAASDADAKTFNLDPCTKSSCESKQGQAADATDHYYQGCEIDGVSARPASMSCHIKNLWDSWDACQPAANSGSDKMWCSCTNANIVSKDAKIQTYCHTD